MPPCLDFSALVLAHLCRALWELTAQWGVGVVGAPGPQRVAGPERERSLSRVIGGAVELRLGEECS